MTAMLFLTFGGLLAATVIAVSVRYLSSGTARLIVVGLAVWLGYVGCMSYFGATKYPAGAAFILAPVFLFVMLYLAPSASAGRIAAALPIWLPIGLETFRIGVEQLIHALWMEGIVPKMLTYEGANVDILIGLTAPVAAWLATKGRAGARFGLVWNVLGLMALANIAIRFNLTTPGPMHLLQTEVPNRAISTFPYTYIPGFFAPLAVVLHVLSIRSLRARLRG